MAAAEQALSGGLEHDVGGGVVLPGAGGEGTVGGRGDVEGAGDDVGGGAPVVAPGPLASSRPDLGHEGRVVLALELGVGPAQAIRIVSPGPPQTVDNVRQDSPS